jgi:hypothetical protein
MREHIASSYCILLFIHGDDSAANRSTRKTIDGAVDQVSRMMRQMPKSIEKPPRTISVTPSMRDRERVMLWSIGVSPGETDEPHVALIYGRGRRIGPLLRGSQITEESLIRVMSYIGASCECGLDRSWILGQMIPLVWGSEIQSAVIESLGFDPDSPMVKTEISQILSMGALDASALDEQDVTDTYRYSEQVVEFEDRPHTDRISPAELNMMNSSNQSSSDGGLTARTAVLTMLLLALIISLGGAIILMRSRRRQP